MRKILIIFATIFFIGTLFAQTHNEQVTVIAPYQPTVLEAYKINMNPQTIDSALMPRAARYDILSRKVMTSFGIDNIKPAKVAGEPISKLSPLYVRAGGGNYKTAYGEVFYGSERSERWQYGAHLKHRSSQGTFDDYEVPFDNSVNLVELYGDHYGEKVLLSANFYYDRKRYSLYAAQPDFLQFSPWNAGGKFLTDKLYKRVYSNIGGSLAFADNNTDPNSVSYSGKLTLNGFDGQDPLSSVGNEFSVTFTGNVHQTIDFNHPIFNETTVGLDATMDWNKLAIDEFTYWQGDQGFLVSVPFGNARMLKFRPYGKVNLLGHDLLVGFRINTFDEFDGGNARVKTALQFVPTIHAKFNLIDNLFAVQFGLDGNVEYPTQRSAVNINPFLLEWRPETGLFEPQLHREYYLGLNTALSKTIDFSLKGQLVSYKNLLNFDNYIVPRSIFLPRFSDPYFEATFQDINCFQLQAGLNYHLDEKIAVSAMARTNFYDNDILYKPKYEANLTARYNMQDKIILKTQLYFASEIYYRPYFGSISPGPSLGGSLPDIEKYNPTVDWNIGAEYRFNKQWGAFLELNNLLNQRSYEWCNYGSYRFNFLAGITFNL
ncbi:MAG: TonB-dependent receptor [Bacteroidales bacterium]|jgi:hypothetical protein|nr:TonB-dependent receptor [Bacteroidales bacterium]